MQRCMSSSPKTSNVDTAPDETCGRTVFLVDDDDALIEALTELLRDEGYVVEAYTSAFAALARLEAGARPDVILLDYLMPEMRGDAFLAALDDAGIDVPVMLLSAMCESRLRLPSRRLHAWIRKPFDLGRLLDELARLAA